MCAGSERRDGDRCSCGRGAIAVVGAVAATAAAGMRQRLDTSASRASAERTSQGRGPALAQRNVAISEVSVKDAETLAD